MKKEIINLLTLIKEIFQSAAYKSIIRFVI